MRAYAHDLSTQIFASTDQDQPFPYGALAACPGGTVLIEGSAAFPSRLRLTALDGPTPGTDTTAMGWEVDASGLADLLIRVKKEYTSLPIYITENGAAFDDYVDPNGNVIDNERIDYLRDHITAVRDAMDAGVNER